MKLTLPEMSLVLLVGVSGSGKSSFARRHFLPSEVISSDFCRGLVSDDENSLEASGDAFDLLFYIARKRLTRGRLTVIDATNVRKADRKKLIDLAFEYHCLPVAIVLDLPVKLCLERNRERPDRDFGAHVIHNQHKLLSQDFRNMRREGFRYVYALKSVEDVDSAEIERQALYNDKRAVCGPFDIIGDVHGCFDELCELLTVLGYRIERDPAMAEGDWEVVSPLDLAGQPRTVILLGDLVDRGPKNPAVLRLAMRMRANGSAYVVPGNHDMKLMRALRGDKVTVAHGMQESLDQLAAELPEFRQTIHDWLDSLVSHYVFDGGNLVVAHAGLKEEMQGRGSRYVREFCLYGETTGETDEFGLPVRYNWAAEYRGKAAVVYGHTPIPEPQWLNNTINIDTGCVFGGRLTALRYPERELVSVEPLRQYAVPARPILLLNTPDAYTAQQEHDDLLRYEDVCGKLHIETRLLGKVGIGEEQSAAALEVLSRFAIDPRWLIYLPPTMSPPATSANPLRLEEPAEVFSYFRRERISQLICEEKHMGSRAVVILCRDSDCARERFGIRSGESAVCYTRTGRRFFEDSALETAFFECLRAAAETCGFWERHATDWLCLDCELLPWSQKAQGLLEEQYASTGSAGRAALRAAVQTLGQAAGRLGGPLELTALLERMAERERLLSLFTEAYRRYCWPVESLQDIHLAPFHLLATEGSVHTDKSQLWHLEEIGQLCDAQPGLLMRTAHHFVDLEDAASVEAASSWWEELTSAGGEGMVVKPLGFTVVGRHGLVQPGVKCRGSEYLRIIYGPEYSLPMYISQLRQRSLTRKRNLALKEYALGVEALERFVRAEPLRRVHECVFGVMALESEAVDPRL